MKVIASAGSESKLEMMRSLGADHVFNYKTEGYDKPLAKYGPLDIVYVSEAKLFISVAHLCPG